jgi:hypothetical protein
MYYVDPGYNAIKLEGGQALLNGNIVTIPTITLAVPNDGESATYNVIIDSNGVVKMLRDNFYEIVGGVVFTNPSAQEIINSKDKLLLAQIDVDSFGEIVETRDYRRYVNTIDNKLELIVEENEITNGSFASLSAAVNYLNVHGNGYSGSRVIKIRGIVEYDLSQGPLYLPDGVMLEGENYGNMVGVGSGTKIVLVGASFVGTSLASFIVPGNQCSIKNINIECEDGSSCLSIIGSSSNIYGLRVEGCSFKNTTANFVITAPMLSDCTIKDCYSETKTVYVPTNPDSTVLDASGFFIFTFIAENVIVENNICDALGKDVFSFVVLGLSSTYGSPTSSASNVWVTGNKFYASGLTAMISGIHITKCNNFFFN